MRWRRHDRTLGKLERQAQTRLEAARHEADVTARQAPEVARVVQQAGLLSRHNHFADHIRQTLGPRRQREA